MSQLGEAAGGDPSLSPTPEVYVFASFRLNVTARELTRRGHPVPLTPKAFDLLVILVRQRGRVMPRGTLIQLLLAGHLRRGSQSLVPGLDDSPGAGRGGGARLQTVRKHGYRFSADVSTLPGGDVDTARPVPPALDRAAGELPGGAARGPSSTAPRSWRWIAGTAAVIPLVAMLALALSWARAPAGRSGPSLGTVAVPLTAYPGVEGAPSFSPDGSRVVFEWDGTGPARFDLYVRRLGAQTRSDSRGMKRRVITRPRGRPMAVSSRSSAGAPPRCPDLGEARHGWRWATRVGCAAAWAAGLRSRRPDLEPRLTLDCHGRVAGGQGRSLAGRRLRSGPASAEQPASVAD